MRILLPNDGGKRVVRRFAILPIKIEKEIRWFEFVYIEQYYSEFYGSWCNNRFANKSEWKIHKM